MVENTAVRQSRRKSLRLIRLQEQLTGYLFILPALIVILIFGIFPIGYSIYMSLFNWQVTKGPFIGDKNYLLIFGSWWNLLVLVGLGKSVSVFEQWSTPGPNSWCVGANPRRRDLCDRLGDDV